jgi:hypothetical protein
MVFLVSWGPWGAEGVSLASQRARLKGLLVKNRLLVDGRIVKAGGVAPGGSIIPLEDRKAISDVTQYIVEVHGYRVFKPLLNIDLDSLMKLVPRSDSFSETSRRQDETEALLAVMGVRYADRWTEAAQESFYVVAERDEDWAIPVHGYDHLLKNVSISVNDTMRSYDMDGHSLKIRLDSTTNRLLLFPDKDSALAIGLSGMAMTGAEHKYSRLPGAKMILSVANSQWACRLVLEDLNGVQQDKKRWVTSLQGLILVGKR